MDFTLMEKATGKEVTDFNRSMGPHKSLFTEGQYWYQGTVVVEGLAYSVILVTDENDRVIGAEKPLAPGLSDVVTFIDTKQVNGRPPNTGPEEMFSEDYHYQHFGEGRDIRDPVEKFGRLD